MMVRMMLRRRCLMPFRPFRTWIGCRASRWPLLLLCLAKEVAAVARLPRILLLLEEEEEKEEEEKGKEELLVLLLPLRLLLPPISIAGSR